VATGRSPRWLTFDDSGAGHAATGLAVGVHPRRSQHSDEKSAPNLPVTGSSGPSVAIIRRARRAGPGPRGREAMALAWMNPPTAMPTHQGCSGALVSGSWVQSNFS
jgi:hypothetical protein